MTPEVPTNTRWPLAPFGTELAKSIHSCKLSGDWPDEEVRRLDDNLETKGIWVHNAVIYREGSESTFYRIDNGDSIIQPTVLIR
jgi:hypothetical protein